MNKMRTHLWLLSERLDELQYRFAIWIVPVLAAVFAACAMALWPNLVRVEEGQTVAFRLFHDKNGDLSPAQASAKLAEQVPQARVDNLITDKTVWVAFERNADRLTWLHFPSKNAVSMACWSGATQKLGKADRDSEEGAMRRIGAGFALVAGAPSPEKVICRTQFLGASRFSVVERQAADFENLASRFAREAG